MHIAACSRPIWWCTGALRARTYDRLGDEPGALLLRPAGDRRLERGQVSTIGRRRENVHWFVPLTSRAATFDVIVTGLEPTGPEYQVLAFDPLGSADLGEGTLRVTGTMLAKVAAAGDVGVAREISPMRTALASWRFVASRSTDTTSASKATLPSVAEPKAMLRSAPSAETLGRPSLTPGMYFRL